MANTVAYAASMCTRKTNSSSNAKNGVACQEFYDSSYNYVGIVCFSGMNLANKVITGIWLSIDAARAGYGAGSKKTVYMRKANYQNSIASGVTGSNYAGAALGTFDGSFFGNSTAYQITGTLFNNMAAYISQGNNTFTIYNPSPSASSQGYSYNYLQWSAVTITITYEEAVSQPSTSASSVNMGSAVTIYTNRVSTSTTHTLLYTFGNTSGTIATNVGASVNWAPALTLAAQIPNATSGTCTITCQSYNGGTLTGTRTCTITLNVPATVVPSISSVTVEDTVTTVMADRVYISAAWCIHNPSSTKKAHEQQWEWISNPPSAETMSLDQLLNNPKTMFRKVVDGTPFDYENDKATAAKKEKYVFDKLDEVNDKKGSIICFEIAEDLDKLKIRMVISISTYTRIVKSDDAEIIKKAYEDRIKSVVIDQFAGEIREDLLLLVTQELMKGEKNIRKDLKCLKKIDAA